MRMPDGVLARVAGSVLALGLLSAASASAQETPATEAGEPPDKEQLEQMLDVRSTGNEAAVSAQKRIDSISDETDSLVAEYRTVLKQIDSTRIYNSQMRELVEFQETELASLNDQLDRVELVGRSVTPLMLRMIEAIDMFVQLDVPFLKDERAKRMAELRGLMRRADVTNAEKYRQIMEAYQIENEYGRTIEAYRGTLKIGDRETTVDFLRFGRIALVYQSLDETQSGVWNKNEKRWDPLDSSHRSAIRQGLRIARKQAAPDLIRLPLPAAGKPRGVGGAS